MAGSTSGTYIVTGAAGFIGARVVEALRAEGSNVVSVDFHAQAKRDADVTSAASPGREQYRGDAFTRPEHARVDFGTKLDLDALGAFLERDRPADLRAIVHLGACSDTMEMDEALFTRLNLDYSRALWSFAAAHRIPLVYASSAATYGAGENGYDDDEARVPSLRPLNPYGWSKQHFDLWALDRERTGVHPPRWAGFKFFNVYGFGERHKKKMASVVLHGFDQIRRDGKVRLFQSHKPGVADGEQKRDFVYVGDVVDVLLFAARGGIERGIYNLGTGEARSFADLTRATFRALGREPDIEFIPMPEELRARYQYFTEAKMARLRSAGYTRPFTSLEDGVSAYVARLVAEGG